MTVFLIGYRINNQLAALVIVAEGLLSWQQTTKTVTDYCWRYVIIQKKLVIVSNWLS